MAEFLPLAHRFAAALEQVPADEAARDPAAAVHAITSAARQFGWSLTVTHWDLGVEAEALGAELTHDPSGASVTARRPGTAAEAASVITAAAIAHRLAVTRGIRGTLGPGMGLAAMLTGPRTLSGLLTGGGRLDALYGPLIRAYVEAGADRLLIVEGRPAVLPAGEPVDPVRPAGAPVDPVRPAGAAVEASRALRSVASTARYFRVLTMVLDLGDTDLADYPGFDHVFGRDDAVLLPASAICGAPGDASAGLAGASVVTTAGQIPADCPPALVARWTEHIRRSGKPDSPMVS
jgi:Uroporphyrinogen decarboxylase (URO-D)